jgi:hypothetical protein
VAFLDLVLLMALGMPGPLMSAFVFGTLAAGVLAAVLPFLKVEMRTYAVYRDALVIVEEDDYLVVPWEALAELNAPRTLVTADGERFPLGLHVENLGRLYDKVQRRLPQALAAVQAGGSVSFGPFTVSSRDIGYRGNTLPWGKVDRMQISGNSRLGTRLLVLWKAGSFTPWCRGDLNGIANDWLLLEVIRCVCPPRLLVPAET